LTYSQLRLEIRLLSKIVHINYVIIFPALENYVFSPSLALFGSYKDQFRPIGQEV